jgi:hypothetical protein
MSIIYLGIGLMGLIKKRPESEWGFVLWFGQFGLAEMMLCLTEISNQFFLQVIHRAASSIHLE